MVEDGWREQDSATFLSWGALFVPQREADQPATTQQLLNWLSDAGFSEVDLVRQSAGHALPAAFA
jgi:hypothetical protein